MLARAVAIVLAALALPLVGCGDAERPGGRAGPSGSTLRATLTDPDGNGFL